MRVVESVGFYFPDSVGGSEVYVSALANKLQAHGIECVVAAPHQSSVASACIFEGTEVFRYPFPERPRRGETQGRVPPRQFAVFETWLREQAADVYHQHSWTTGCGLWHLKAAKRLGLKTVVTVHVPGNICMRGTMLLEGRAACDGEIVPERCASCWLQSKGLSQTTARAFAAMPENLGRLVRLPKLGPALGAKALALGCRKDLQGMFAATDRVVAVCSWIRDALLVNGEAAQKVVLNRQGVDDNTKFGASTCMATSPEVLRFGFLGRWDRVKGVHLLVEAFSRVPKTLPIELYILAAYAGAESRKYCEAVRRSVAGDPRIHFLPDAQKKGSADFLASIDALIVPSQWLETGPLVVLEAFAAKRPVIGSDLGGIREIVSHERDGLLVSHADVNAWTTAMVRLASDRGLLERLRQGIGPVRTMSDVACDMVTLYRDLFAIKTHAA
jgi:glycosyltransferase involved in cell wall biosynthesis